MSSLKQILKSKKKSLGSWISMPNTFTCEILAQADFEWLVVDMEHASISNETAAQLIQVIDLNGKHPIVRVGANDPLIIKQSLDAGAHGIMVPMINSKEDAEKAIRSIHYPPRGERGTGLWRAQRYGLNFENYRKQSFDESVFIAQIEHVDGVRNIESILALTEVDGIIVGPYDLSASLGVAGQFDHPDVKKALDQISKACLKAGKSLGYHLVHPSHDRLKQLFVTGYQFIALGVDMIYLSNSVQKSVAEAKEVLK